MGYHKNTKHNQKISGNLSHDSLVSRVQKSFSDNKMSSLVIFSTHPGKTLYFCWIFIAIVKLVHVFISVSEVC